MILPIYVCGQPVLKEMAEDTAPEYLNLRKLIASMFETMVHADGVGLATPQIGLPIHVVTITLDPLSEDYPKFKDFNKAYINPHVIEVGREGVGMEEGCLSLLDIHESVKRGDKIHTKYMDENFVEHDEVMEGYLARVMQHGLSHLDGKMFIDRLSPLCKQMIRGKLNTMLKEKTRSSYKMKQVK